jgi:hypothetical protein
MRRRKSQRDLLRRSAVVMAAEFSAPIDGAISFMQAARILSQRSFSLGMTDQHRWHSGAVASRDVDAPQAR